jgi:hypothetical protein
VDNGKEEKVKKGDFKKGWGGDKKGRIRDGGEEGHHLEEDEGDEVIDVDQKGSQGIEEKGEKGSQEAERDDEKAYPRDE